MRTNDPAYIWEFRPPRSPGTTAAGPLPRENSTAAAPRSGIVMILNSTSRRSGDSETGVSRGRGVPRGFWPQWPTSSCDMGGGPPRGTSARTTDSPATRPYGTGSGASPRRSSLPGAEGNRRAGGRRAQGGGRPFRSSRSFFCLFRRSLGDLSEIPRRLRIWTPICTAPWPCLTSQ
jgi:hypothetical protein